ncbi:MAG: ATP-binding protein [Bacteroidia bacterium]|nr:ATP-binding protein [Bacteroidia bacterium]
MYSRYLKGVIENKFGKGKALVISGPRQVGKTTLIQQIIKNKKHLFLDGDDPTTRGILSDANTETLRQLLSNHTLVFIDEAQRIPGIGITAKIITDQFKKVQLILSGSSSFDLASNLNEPLTGRKWEYELFPISWEEFEGHHGFLEARQQLENRLRYGFYPDVLNNPGSEEEILNQLVNSYLYRDLLAFSGIQKPAVLEKLMQALAHQMGNEVSYNELSQLVGIDKNTVSKYLDILEKGFVIFRLGSYSNNLRNEIKRNQKIYFVDNGVRNTVIGNFQPIDLRADKGKLWENFLVSERRKQAKYKFPFVRQYFWRTTQQQEVDLVEIKGDEIKGFEFKWNPGKTVKLPVTFTHNYHAAEHLVNRDNFGDFVNFRM